MPSGHFVSAKLRTARRVLGTGVKVDWKIQRLTFNGLGLGREGLTAGLRMGGFLLRQG